MPRKKLTLYNTLSRKKEVFKPLKGKKVGLYTCGPTVYNFAHIGNLRTYIFEDILERTLKENGYAVKRVMNITDVGHLSGDSDEGMDKMERNARTKGDVQKIARTYTKAFLADLAKLNVRIPKTLAPASKYIPQQIKLVEQLVKKGFVYETEEALYFDVMKFSGYGKLSGQALSEKTIAARAEVVMDAGKKHPADFAVWFKTVGRFARHIQHWPSPWGKGFPGWHLECSAIARHFLGQPFDIHTGGVDHIGTHHENEIAQSEAAFGKPLARVWLHGEFLQVDEAKMAKSEGNFYTLADLEEKQFSPLAFRYLVLGAHYRTKLNFSFESLHAAQSTLMHLYNRYRELKLHEQVRLISAPGLFERYRTEFWDALNNDLNTPQAVGILHQALGNALVLPKEKVKLLEEFDAVLGLGLRDQKLKAMKIPNNVQLLLARREEARRNKQFIQSDALRDEIDGLGFIIIDTPEGPQLRKK
jgi:cysteinyl-tRNA synthetase